MWIKDISHSPISFFQIYEQCYPGNVSNIFRVFCKHLSGWWAGEHCSLLGESTGGIFPGGRMSKLSADGGCWAPPPPQTPIPHFYWSKGGYSQLNPDPNIWFTEVITGGYWGLLWLENYVVWIVLEPWLNTFRCMPLTSKVLINFKWAIGGHLHHNVTFVFAPKWIMVVDYA